MKKLLITGITTRSQVNSALKLNYEVYSTSYFSTYDFIKPKYEKHLLNQVKGKSSKKIEENYTTDKLLNLSKDYLEEVDYIIPVSGISPEDFKDEFKKKIIGNKKTNNLDNKFDFYKKIKNKFLTPETFKVKDIGELKEIIKNNETKQYLLKPVKGYGGYYINFVNYDTLDELNDLENDWIIQEYITGKNLSSSVLGLKNSAKTIMNSRNLNESDFKNDNSFIYSGNLLPLDSNTLNIEFSSKIIKEMETESEDIIRHFNLIGSNGVDYILDKNNDLYVIEVNPRFQGTYESCESVLNINMVEAHIKACNNELIKINNDLKSYSIKKIIYSENKIKIPNFNIKNLYDIPYPETIVEKNQPLATIICKNNNIKKLCEDLKSSTIKLKEDLSKMQ